MVNLKRAVCGISAMAAALCITASAEATTVNLTPVYPGTITGSVSYTTNEILNFSFTIKPKFKYTFTDTAFLTGVPFPFPNTATGGSGPTTITFGPVPDTATVDYSLTTSAVPESATWVLMLAGFGLIGASARRRTRLVAA